MTPWPGMELNTATVMSDDNSVMTCRRVRGGGGADEELAHTLHTCPGKKKDKNKSDDQVLAAPPVCCSAAFPGHWPRSECRWTGCALIGRSLAESAGRHHTAAATLCWLPSIHRRPEETFPWWRARLVITCLFDALLLCDLQWMKGSLHCSCAPCEDMLPLL